VLLHGTEVGQELGGDLIADAKHVLMVVRERAKLGLNRQRHGPVVLGRHVERR
jgi:hypothetical protein